MQLLMSLTWVIDREPITELFSVIKPACISDIAVIISGVNTHKQIGFHNTGNRIFKISSVIQRLIPTTAQTHNLYLYILFV